MSETVVDTEYQRLHHMVSDSTWDRQHVRAQLITDANAHFGHTAPLVIDESACGKKGKHSAGVARQWNGRLGKTDNCQVGVFAAIVRDGVAALVDGELYIPKEWIAEPKRCLAAGIPEKTEFREKGEMALSMIRRLRKEGLHFAYSVFDGGYGHLPWLLRALDDDQEIFLAEVHSNQSIYLADPRPVVPARRSTRGKAPSRLKAQSESISVKEWAASQKDDRWERISVRDGEKGAIVADYLTERVWLWDNEEKKPRRWHLLVRRELDGITLKYCLSNAKPTTRLRKLARMQVARHFVERSFEDAKGACGMAEYQVRGWRAWHNHMTLVMIALMFLAKERLQHRKTAELLSCNDLVEIMRHKLPSKIDTDADLAASIVQRHCRRQRAKESAYRKQGRSIPRGACTI